MSKKQKRSKDDAFLVVRRYTAEAEDEAAPKTERAAFEAKEGKQLTVKCEDGAVLKGTKFVLRFAYVTANGIDSVYDADPQGKEIHIGVDGDIENMQTEGTTITMYGNVQNMWPAGSTSKMNFFSPF
jgi:hypothetical protein